MARNESPWLCCWLELAALKNRQRLAYAATVAGLLEREGWAIEAPPEPTPAAIAAAAMAADQLAAIAFDAQTAEDAELAQLLAAVLAHRPQPRAWPRPRPPYLPHPRRRLPRLRGVVRVRSKPWPAWVA
jgi:hypothetical protein